MTAKILATLGALGLTATIAGHQIDLTGHEPITITS